MLSHLNITVSLPSVHSCCCYARFMPLLSVFSISQRLHAHNVPTISGKRPYYLFRVSFSDVQFTSRGESTSPRLFPIVLLWVISPGTPGHSWQVDNMQHPAEPQQPSMLTLGPDILKPPPQQHSLRPALHASGLARSASSVHHSR